VLLDAARTFLCKQLHQSMDAHDVCINSLRYIYLKSNLNSQTSKSGRSYGKPEAGASGSTSKFTSSTQDLATSKSDDDSYFLWIICYQMKSNIAFRRVWSIFHTENDTLASAVSSSIEQHHREDYPRSTICKIRMLW